MKSNRPPPPPPTPRRVAAPPPPPARRGSSAFPPPQPRRWPPRRLPPPLAAALGGTVLVVLAVALLGPSLLPGAHPTPTPTPTSPGATGTPAATATPGAPEPTWASRPADALPADAALAATASGRPLVTFLEDPADAASRVWCAYDPADRTLRTVPVQWRAVRTAAGAVDPNLPAGFSLGVFQQNGAADALAYASDGLTRVFRASDGGLFFALPLEGVVRVDPAALLAGTDAIAELLTPTKTADGYDRDALNAFQREDGWTLTWANRPRIDAGRRFLFYTTDRRGFLADGTVHADLRQTTLADGTDAVLAQDAKPVAVVGDVLVYEKRDARLYLRDVAAGTGAAGSAEVRWTGALDQYALYGPWLAYTTSATADGTKHLFRRVPDAAGGASPVRSIACAATGRLANLYRMAPDGDTLGMVWLSDRTKAASAKLVVLTLSTGAFRVYDLAAALAADGAVDSASFQGWAADGSVLVAAVRAGQEPRMRIVDLAGLSPLDAGGALSVREEAT